MSLLELAPVVADSAGELRAADRDAGPVLHVAEQALGNLQDLRRFNLATRRQNQARWDELVAQPVAAVLGGDAGKGLCAAEHRAAERLPVERSLEQMVMDEVVRRIRHLAE